MSPRDKPGGWLCVTCVSDFQVNETDKARLDYLLSTWESGMFFHRDVLLHMRSFIGRRIVCVPRPVSAFTALRETLLDSI